MCCLSRPRVPTMEYNDALGRKNRHTWDLLCSIVLRITAYPQFGQCPGGGSARVLRRCSQYVANEEIPHHLTGERRLVSVVLVYHERSMGMWAFFTLKMLEYEHEYSCSCSSAVSSPPVFLTTGPNAVCLRAETQYHDLPTRCPPPSPFQPSHERSTIRRRWVVQPLAVLSRGRFKLC